MSNTTKVILGLIVVTVVAAVPIISSVSSKLNFIPSATPIEVPSALRNTEKTFASTSATPKISASPTHK